jgi:hypothetical protein
MMNLRLKNPKTDFDFDFEPEKTEAAERMFGPEAFWYERRGHLCRNDIRPHPI